MTKRHLLWELAKKRAGTNPQDPTVYKIGEKRFLVVNRLDDLITITIEAEREEITWSKECFALNTDGSCDVTVSADIPSALTGRVSVAMKTIHTSRTYLERRDILGYNWVADQLDILHKILLDRRRVQVDPRDRTKIIARTR